jgi:hypothetical protein
MGTPRGNYLGAFLPRTSEGPRVSWRSWYVVGVFSNLDALLRLAGAVLVEAHDEWQTGDRRYLAEGSTTLLHTQTTSNSRRR